MSLLIFSPKCSHSNDLIDYLNRHPQFKSVVKFHNINVHGIPPQFKSKIKNVPTLITTNGKILVGKEIKNWFDSLLPNKDIVNIQLGGGGFGLSSLDDNDGNDDFSGGFSIDNYGQSLQPAMTPELEARITRDVKDAYTSVNETKNN